MESAKSLAFAAAGAALALAASSLLQRRTDPPASRTRSYVIRLVPGDEVYTKLNDFVAKMGLKAAFVATCVGSVQWCKLRLAHATAESRNHVLERSEKFEIVSLTGTFNRGGCHLHTSLSDMKGETIGGHLLGMKVFTTAEIVITECVDLSFSRPFDERTGFGELAVGPRAGDKCAC
jgi:predicted DNA-binding protein with PD1-like motif